MRTSFTCCWALFLITNISAQQDSLKVIKLEPITLNVSRISEEDIKLPISISHKAIEKSQDLRQQLSFNEYLLDIPGLFALNANNFSQDLRISIRGFGARSAFGIRGIKILVDGIPETTPDGQGQIDNLNLAIIKNIEVIRGPSSALYGNASGGVISINTIDNVDENFVKARLSVASYGMEQYQATIGLKAKQANYIFQGSRINTNGYRQRSGFENYNFNVKMLYQFSEASKLNFLMNYTNSPYAEDAGGLTLEELTEDREQARQRNEDFKTEEAVSQFKIGGSYEHTWKAGTFNTYGFYSSRNFYGLLPFEFGGIVDLSRNYFGHGSHFTFQHKFTRTANKLQLGYDFAVQDDERLRFINLEGNQGANTFDQRESFRSFGVFILDHYTIGNFLIRAGIRYDNNVLKAKDRFFSDGDDSGSISLNAFNPSLSFNYKMNAKNYVYASFSTSFETPTLSELSSNPLPQGGFNESLKAQKARNYELGYKVKHETRHVEIALFYIETDNDLVPFELEAFPDRTFFRNAGSTTRKGVEISYNQMLVKNLNLTSSYTYSNFKYASYEIPSGSFDDKQLPGIPKHLATASLSYESKNGLTVSMQTKYVGTLYTSDANTVEDSAYNITNFNFGYRLLTKQTVFFPFLGINNVFNTKYNDNIRINAFGGRYYEPAPGINVFGGVRVVF